MGLRFVQLAGAFTLLALLAACSLPLQPRIVDAHCPPPPDRALNTGEVLRYNSCLYSLAPDALAREYALVDQHFSRTGSGIDRVKLALLLSIPDTAFHDTSRAQQVLNASDIDSPPDDLRDLARLLSATLGQQARLDDQAQNLEKDLAAEKAHAAALQDKIDSVKDLERKAMQKDMP